MKKLSIHSLFLILGLFSLPLVLLVHAQIGNAEDGIIKYQADKIVIIPKRNSVQLTGNAVLTKGQDRLQANSIIIEKQRNFAYAEKSVRFHSKKSNLFFEGNSAEYDMKKDIITGKSKPVVTKPSDNVVFSANKMIGDLKKNIFHGINNAKLLVNTNEQQVVITGKNGNYFVNQKLMELTGGVEMYNAKDRENNAIVTCQTAKVNLANDVLSCLENSRMTNSRDNSLLLAESFNFNKKRNFLFATNGPQYFQTNNNSYISVTSDSMERDENKEIIYLKKTVQAKFYSLISGEKTHQLECEDASIIKNVISCIGNAKLIRVEDNSYTSGDKIVYDNNNKKGRVEGNPYIALAQQSNTLFFHSQIILIDENKKEVTFAENVLIADKKKGSMPPPNDTITCDKAAYYYGMPNTATTANNITHFSPFFICNGNVVLRRLNKDLIVYANKLTHYTEKEISQLREDVHFAKTNSASEVIIGDAEKIDIIGKDEQINFINNLRAFRTVPKTNSATIAENPITNATFTANKATYYYNSNSNYFQAEEDVRLTNITDNYFVLSENMQYYAKDKNIIFSNSPVFGKSARNNQIPIWQLVYANNISILEEQQTATLEKDIYITELPTNFATPRFHHWILQTNMLAANISSSAITNIKSDMQSNISTLQNNVQTPYANRYIACQNGIYYYEKNIDRIDCNSNTLAVEKAEGRTYKSEKTSYYAKKRLLTSFTTTTLTERNPTNNSYRILQGDEFELDEVLKQATLNSNVIMHTFDADDNMLDEVLCDESKYIFLIKEKRTISCVGNLTMQNFVDQTFINGERLQHFVEEDYSIVTGSPFFSWLQDTGETTAIADVFEYFHKDAIVYGKGNVEVDDGTYLANASFANYDTRTKKIRLFGNTKITRTDGSEFFAEDVVFDINSHKIDFTQKIRGSLPLQ